MMSRAPAKASSTSPMMTSSSDPVFSLRYRAMNGMVAPSPRSLLGEGATIPFIARYRKEKTGSLDEVIIGEVEDALAGARDIIAEWVNEDIQARQGVRRLFYQEGIIQSTVVKDKEKEGIKYSNYFDWREPVNRVPG